MTAANNRSTLSLSFLTVIVVVFAIVSVIFGTIISTAQSEQNSSLLNQENNSVAAVYTVTNLNDNGAGSLRQAIIDANNTAGDDVISFQSGLSGTITLTSGQLLINSSIIIDGPGANLLSINGNNIGRIFGINASGHAVVITGIRVFGGNPGFDGGAINNSGGLLTLNNMIIEANRAGSFNTQHGGGIYSSGNGSSLTINNSSILNNTAPIGGGIYTRDGQVTLNNVNISNNTASFSNGGLRVSGGELRITGGIISNNTTDHLAGGIEFSGGKITLTGVTISNNRATGSESRGGGIILQGDLTMTDCAVMGNSSGIGGGMNFYSGTGVIKGTTFSRNTAGSGGGLYLGGAGTQTTLTMVNSTVSNNTSTAFQGGGIYNYPTGKTTLRNVTVAANTTTGNEGGGIYNIGSLTMANTIVADNTASSNPDLSGTFTSLGNNLIRNRGSSSGYITSDLPNASDPKLDILKNNGGPTETHGLLTGSAAIDKGDNAQALDTDNSTPLTTDQRGTNYQRIVDGDGNGVATVDIGAFEAQSQGNNCTYSLTPTSLNIAKGGGSSSVSINTGAGCVWTATSNDSWITVTSGNGGNGSGTVSFIVEPNTGIISRTGTVTIAGQTVFVNQAKGCSFALSATSATIAASGATGSLNVSASEADCTWAATSGESWITITSGVSGTGNGTVAFSVAVNNGGPRTGTIIIGGQTFTINQATSGPIVVTNLNDSGAGSLRQAILDANNALSNGTIVFQQALTGAIVLTNGELLITSNVIITGPGSNLLTVQRDSTSPGFRIFNIQQGYNVSINGLAIAGGRVQDTNNQLNRRGAGILNQGNLTLSNSIVRDNVMTGGSGAGIYNEGTLNVTDSIITENRIEKSYGSSGGGIYNRGTLSLANTTVSLNSVTAVQSSFGGGIANPDGTVNINNCFITGNNAIGSTDGSVRGDATGGGIGSNTNLIISNTTISGNSARYINTLNSVSGSASGGGVSGSGTFTNSIISNNSTSCVSSCYTSGGGISGGGTFINSTISNNSAATANSPTFPSIGGPPSGGGISGSGTFVNSTISGNSVSGLNSRGGGISGNDNIFNNSTISNNSASGTNNRGGGLWGQGTFSNTIISNNTATTAPDIDGAITSQGFNLIGNTAGNSGWTTTDLLNQDAKLAPLADNGGPTRTHALLPGSPAINAGNNANAPATDQRGLPRIVGGTIDIGAYEEQQLINCTYSLSSTTANITASGGNGSVNVSTATGCTWTAVSNDSWISVTTGNNGTGNGTVNFSVQANSGTARTGTITIGGQTFTVNQANGCSFSLPTTTVTSPSTGSTGSFNVFSGTGCTWTATTAASWIIITAGANGSGNGTVFFQAAANNGAPRTGIITVGNQSFTVNQSGANCSFILSPTSVNVGVTGGSAGFNINTANGCTWTAVSDSSWITVTSNSSGSGAGTVSYSIQANNTGAARQGTITAGGQTFTINQSATCSYALTPSNFSSGADGGSSTFQINTSSDCGWNAFTPDNWITINSGGGTGNGTVNFTVQANTAQQTRTGTILAGGQTFTVNQSAATAVLKTRFDFDGDGKADISVYRPSLGAWYINQSSNNAFSGMLWGLPGDVITPADFDGDGRTDAAVFRDGFWYWMNSSNNSFSAVKFGQTGDVPIPSDYDNDGKADVAVFRENVSGAGNRTYFYILQSSDNSFRAEQFGATGDKPVSADFDKDGKADLAVYRDGSLSGGQSYFFYRPTSQPGTNFSTIAWGVTGDKPAAADFDGDGKQDAAVFRPSTGDWYILRSSDNQFTAIHFGISEDIPVAADYDGDGKADVAVFRPSTGSWYLQRSTAGFTGMQFGVSTDKPIPALVQ